MTDPTQPSPDDDVTPPQQPYGAPAGQPFGQPAGQPGAQPAGAVPPQQAYAAAPAAPLDPAQDKQWASFAHLGGILWFLPSLIIWLVFKDRGALTNQEAKEALNWQITWIAVWVVSQILGIIVGSASTIALGQALGWNAVPTPAAIGIAAATSGVIGVVFGFLPARRAASLDPIEALRTE